MEFAVLKLKKIDGVRHLSLVAILDEEIAHDYCKALNEESSKRVFYFCQSVSECKYDIEVSLINRCYNVANCLNVADICLMKRGNKSLEKASYWFDLAKKRSNIVADLLEVVDDI